MPPEPTHDFNTKARALYAIEIRICDDGLAREFRDALEPKDGNNIVPVNLEILPLLQLLQKFGVQAISDWDYRTKEFIQPLLEDVENEENGLNALFDIESVPDILRKANQIFYLYTADITNLLHLHMNLSGLADHDREWLKIYSFNDLSFALRSLDDAFDGLIKSDSVQIDENSYMPISSPPNPVERKMGKITSIADLIKT